MKTVCSTLFIACLRVRKTLLFLLFPCLYWACNETIDSIGMGIQPPEDGIQMYNTTINIEEAYTIKMDSIYTKTVNGLLGNFYDPSYGDIKAGYICQYYPSLGFADSVVNNKIDSVRLKIYYASYFGDSLAPMEVAVYQVTKKPLEDNYYTNINPDDYCDTKKAWGRKPYTIRDLTVADSILDASYYREINVPLPTEWGQEFYDEYRRNGRTFGSLEDFVGKFKGTYVESSFGAGNLIQAEISEIQLFYQNFYINSNGNDTIAIAAAALTVTKEVMQLNIFESHHSNALLLEPSADKMYLKTPVGVCSKIVIPIPKIIDSIGNRRFNSVKLNIGVYAQETHDYTLSLPGVGVSSTSKAKLLLIEQDSVKSFFENQKVADFQTTYTTTYSSSTQTYAFDNIANLIQNAIKKAPEKNLELLLIPVQVEYYSNYTSDMDYSTAHFLFPTAATLKKGGDKLQLKIIASDIGTQNR